MPHNMISAILTLCSLVKKAIAYRKALKKIYISLPGEMTA